MTMCNDVQIQQRTNFPMWCNGIRKLIGMILQMEITDQAGGQD